MNDSQVTSPKFCSDCGHSLRPGAKFCPSCGKQTPSKTLSPIIETPKKQAKPVPESSGDIISSMIPTHAVEVIQETDQATTTGNGDGASIDPASTPEGLGYQLTIQSIPPQARGRVLLALKQTLGLAPSDAQAYLAALPVLLAVGLSFEVAETLRTALTNAGAEIIIKEPPRHAEAVKSSEKIPEPRRRMALQSETVTKIDIHAGLRTVTGLDIGQTYSYLAFARADGENLVMPPDMVRINAQTGTPTAIQPAREGVPMCFGTAALAEWVKASQDNSAGIFLSLLDKVGEDEEGLPVSSEPLRRYLEVLANRLGEVLVPGALSIVDGATSTLGIPADWDQGRIERLVEIATLAGFPINRVCPRPVAALTHHLQTGTLHQGSTMEKTLVVDWGGSSLCFSFVEHGGSLIKPLVFEHLSHPYGGVWFDQIIMEKLSEQLPTDLNDADQRSLLLFSRSFKEQMSRAFADGKNIYTQYCVIPAGSPPLRTRLSQAEFEEMIDAGRSTVKQALLDAVIHVGLKPEHLDHVILCGGGSNWYFAREIIRSTLGQVPLISARPEESVARGLAAYRLII
jgi:hypothetical protein